MAGRTLEVRADEGWSVGRMRGVITICGRPVMATLSHGQPDILGRKLTECGYHWETIVGVVQKHRMYFLDPRLFTMDLLACATQEEDLDEIMKLGQIQYEYRADGLYYRDVRRADSKTRLVRLTEEAFTKREKASEGSRCEATESNL